MLNLFISIVPPLIKALFNPWLWSGNGYHAGYRIKIKVICRLRKDGDHGLISISTKQEFPPQINYWEVLCFIIHLKDEILKKFSTRALFKLWSRRINPQFRKQNLKGTVSVISCDPSCRHGNARFTTVLSAVLSDQVWILDKILMFIILKTFKPRKTTISFTLLMFLFLLISRVPLIITCCVCMRLL